MCSWSYQWSCIQREPQVGVGPVRVGEEFCFGGKRIEIRLACSIGKIWCNLQCFLETRWMDILFFLRGGFWSSFWSREYFVDIFKCSGKSPPCFPIFLIESSVVAMSHMFCCLIFKPSTFQVGISTEWGIFGNLLDLKWSPNYYSKKCLEFKQKNWTLWHREWMLQTRTLRMDPS